MIKGVLTILLSTSISMAVAQQIILKSESTGGRMGMPLLPSSEENKEELKAFEPKQFKSLGQHPIETDHEVVYVGKMAPEGVNIYEIPLFGGFQKNLEQLEHDESFLKDCDKNFKTREEASVFFSDMGWQYLSEGSKEMATYRFNLANLLNPDNVDVYWGLGVIEYQKGELEEAIKLMTQGMKADNKYNITLMVDLATVHIKCFKENKHEVDLKRAYKLLDDAILLAPNYANSYIQMALAKLVNGEIDDAWLNFHKGYQADPSSVDTHLLTQLLSIKADPKGVFK
ncbi:MAG: hypothetical protein NXI00_01340 [Cytophagales bacterium]|nr:hypothetical protein [Cytophagales bacterium]